MTSLTDVYLRAFLGPKNGLKAADTPPPHQPARPLELDYPHINTLPEYRAASDKLNHFGKQKAEAERKLANLHKQVELEGSKPERTDEDLISKAEALLAGEVRGVNLQADIHATNKLIDALRQAYAAQHGVLRQVVEQLSRAAGQRYQEEHKKRVKRTIAAVDELNAANRYEQDLHHDLERLGYTGTTLPAMNLLSVEDPNEVCGNRTYYWRREAAAYCRTDEEVASDVRKTRLAAALAK